MRTGLLSLVLAIAALLPCPLLAAEADLSARNEARQLAERGDAAFTEGRCDRAIEWWRKAAAKYDAPSILLRIANCQALLGKIVDAVSTLEEVVSAKLPPNAPPAFAEARARAAADLPKLRDRIAYINLTIDRRGVKDELRLEIDNVKMQRSEGRFAVDPGEHFLHLAAGDGVWDTTLKLGDGTERELSVRLVPHDTSPPFFTRMRVGYIVGAAGLVALGVGTVLGVRALSMAQELDANCPARQCPAPYHGNVDALPTLARATTVTLAVGAGMAAGGAVLMLTDLGPRKKEPRVWVVPMGVGAAVVGSF